MFKTITFCIDKFHYKENLKFYEKFKIKVTKIMTKINKKYIYTKFKMYNMEKIIKIMKKKNMIDPWDQRNHHKTMLECRIGKNIKAWIKI